ncbi:MAG: ABC transporter substrate-binding protein [Spirochaetaceae bacterium]|jgi:NitT/TauT family transport system substrate-binding protein|nr:ABC transporter substrate-binding protein [Spirochaetaceae bacterium]
MKKYLFVLPLLVFIGISGLWATGDGQKKTGKVVIGFQPGASSTLPMLAAEEGYFALAGVDTEFIPFSSTSDGLAALEVGKLDVGVSFGTSAPLTLVTNGAPLVIIAGNATGSHPIFTKPENAALYKDVSGFKGKIVGTPRLFTPDVVFRGALYDAGLEPGRDLEVIEFKRPVDVLEAVKSGKVDVGVGSTAITVQIRDAGLAVPLYTTDLFPHHPCCRVVTTETALKNKRPALVAFIKALLLAEKKFNEDPEAGVQANVHQQNFTEQNARDITFAPHVELAIDPNTKAIVGMFERMKAINYLDPETKVDPYAVIDTSLYQEALERVKKEAPSPYWDTLSARFVDQNT